MLNMQDNKIDILEKGNHDGILQDMDFKRLKAISGPAKRRQEEHYFFISNISESITQYTQLDLSSIPYSNNKRTAHFWS